MNRALSIIHLTENVQKNKLPKFESDLKKLGVMANYLSGHDGVLKVNILKIYPASVYKKVENLAKTYYHGTTQGIPLVGYDPNFEATIGLKKFLVEVSKAITFDPEASPAENINKLIEGILKTDKTYIYTKAEWRIILDQTLGTGDEFLSFYKKLISSK